MRLLLLLFLLPCLGLAQFSDDFNDGDLQQPLWSGDTADFTVSNQILQLNGVSAGSSSVTYNRNLPAHPEHEWSFRLKMAFSPSSQNYSRYYLFCNDPDPLLSTVALYLQFGESGSNDAPELKLLNNTTTIIARGINGSIAMASDMTYTIQCDSNYSWSLRTYDQSGNETLHFTVQHALSQNGNFGGFLCVYTSGNVQNFYLDDIYDDVIRHDTVAPELILANAVAADSVNLLWNEQVDLSLASFYINGLACASYSPVNDKSITIFYSPGFNSGQVNKIITTNVSDQHGNISLSDTAQFEYVKTVTAEGGRLRINEIMADPGNANQLPDAEYIELVNLTGDYLLLDSIYISDGSSEALIVSDTILPHGYKIYSSLADATDLHHSNIPATGLQNFPSFNNSGDTIKILKSNGELIDEMNYNATTYRNSVKSAGGWSLERIDSEFACYAANNWKASEDPAGGTPGRINSVAGIYEDNVHPCLLYAWLPSDSIVRIHYSEAMNQTEATDISNYIITGIAAQPALITTLNEAVYDLHFNQPPESIITIIAEENIADCAGNRIFECNQTTAGKGRSPKENDLLINEILFNPFPGQEDFIELINPTSKIIALDSTRISRKDDLGELKDYTHINANGRCIFPGEIIAFSSDPAKLTGFYPYSVSNQILQQQLPSMNDEYGTICLMNASAEIIYELIYDEEMHHPLLNNNEGVSLERISISGPEDSTNWHSASSSCGYATPGNRNSQSFSTKTQDKFITLPYTLFSPDNDGEKDLLPLQVQFDQAGYC